MWPQPWLARGVVLPRTSSVTVLPACLGILGSRGVHLQRHGAESSWAPADLVAWSPRPARLRRDTRIGLSGVCNSASGSPAAAPTWIVDREFGTRRYGAQQPAPGRSPLIHTRQELRPRVSLMYYSCTLRQWSCARAIKMTFRVRRTGRVCVRHTARWCAPEAPRRARRARACRSVVRAPPAMADRSDLLPSSRLQELARNVDPKLELEPEAQQVARAC